MFLFWEDFMVKMVPGLKWLDFSIFKLIITTLSVFYLAKMTKYLFKINNTILNP